MADGQPADAAPDVTPGEALLGLLEEEEKEEEAPEEPQEESEPDTEDEAGEDESDVSEEAPEEAEEEDAAPATYRVKVDGEEIEVTEDELIRGYSRQQDYTRKTMDLADKRKAAEARETELRETRERYSQKLEQIAAFLKADMGEEPDWETLRAEDPAKYAVAHADWQRKQDALGKVEAEHRHVSEEALQKQQEQLQQFVKQEQTKLLEALPEWKDADKMRAGQKALVEYGQSLGFTEEELGTLVDHRTVVVLDKARRYDELQKKGKTVKEKAAKAPVLKPGTKKEAKSKNASQVEKAAKRFAKSKKPHDATALIEQLLGDDDL